MHSIQLVYTTMSISIKAIAIVFFAFVLVQCTRNENANGEPNNNLNSTWNVESFKLEGEEQIQHTFSAFKVEFKRKTATTGTTTWTIVKPSGATETTVSDYTMMNDGTRIAIDGDELYMEINGDVLTMHGNVGGLSFEIEAEKE